MSAASRRRKRIAREVADRLLDTPPLSPRLRKIMARIRITEEAMSDLVNQIIFTDAMRADIKRLHDDMIELRFLAAHEARWIVPSGNRDDRRTLLQRHGFRSTLFSD